MGADTGEGVRGVKPTREELREAIKTAVGVLGATRTADVLAGGHDLLQFEKAQETLRAFLGSGLEVIHNPGDLIAKVACPCCGAELEIMHGDDEGEIGVLGTGGDCALTDSECRHGTDCRCFVPVDDPKLGKWERRTPLTDSEREIVRRTMTMIEWLLDNGAGDEAIRKQLAFLSPVASKGGDCPGPRNSQAAVPPVARAASTAPALTDSERETVANAKRAADRMQYELDEAANGYPGYPTGPIFLRGQAEDARSISAALAPIAEGK